MKFKDITKGAKFYKKSSEDSPIKYTALSDFDEKTGKVKAKDRFGRSEVKWDPEDDVVIESFPALDEAITGIREGAEISQVIDSLLESNLIRSYHLWHVTSVDYLEDILKDGLIPGRNKPPGQDWEGKYSGTGTYFHASFPEHMMDNLDFEGELHSVILNVVTDLDPSKLRPDEDMGEPDTAEAGKEVLYDGGSVAYLDRLPARVIKSVTVPKKLVPYLKSNYDVRVNVIGK